MAHIHWTDSKTQTALVSTKIEWDFSSNRSEPVAELHGHKFTSVRHGTQWGWSWYEVYCDGKIYQRQGDLPTSVDVVVPFEVALKEPCRCGCTERLAKKLEES